MKNADRARALLEIKSENRNLIFRQSSRYSSLPIQCLPCSQIGIFLGFPAKWPCPSPHPCFLQYLACIAWCQQHSSLFLGSSWSRMNSWNPRMASQSIETTTLIWQMPQYQTNHHPRHRLWETPSPDICASAGPQWFPMCSGSTEGRHSPPAGHHRKKTLQHTVMAPPPSPTLQLVTNNLVSQLRHPAQYLRCALFC